MSCPRRVFTTSSTTNQRVITQSSNGTTHIQTTTYHSGGGGVPTTQQITYNGSSSSSSGWQQITPGTTITTRFVNGVPVEEFENTNFSTPSLVPQNQLANPVPSGGDSGDYSEMVLKHHNILRKKHNVPALVLDRSVTAVAQNWANRLAQENRLYHNPSTSYGENVFQGMGSNSSAQAVCEAFYSEIKDYRFGQGPRGGAVTGHFTQLVWKSSRKLGVGKATSRSGSVFVVCNYDPPGNYNNQYNENVPPPLI